MTMLLLSRMLGGCVSLCLADILHPQLFLVLLLIHISMKSARLIQSREIRAINSVMEKLN